MAMLLRALACVLLMVPADLAIADEPARPSPEQAAWQGMELGMFLHFAPNTWQDREGDDLSTPLDRINPDQLDTEQWVDVAELMGARYIVFVAKHEGGFCWWQTQTTDYSVRSTPWKGGKGDVLRDLAESCRRRGMPLGVYLSPADRKHGAAGGGVCPTDTAQRAYAAIYRQQLSEVLGQYGPMMEVWFDGSNGIDVGDILREHAPRAMVFQGPHATIRWVGNEDGVAPDPAWNAVASGKDPSRWGTLTSADGDPDGDRWLPNECDARMRAQWFWNSKNAGTLKTVDQLMAMYEASVGHGAVLLLNATPDTTGRIPEADAKRAAEFGAEIKRRYGTPAAEGSGRGAIVEVSLPSPTRVDRVVAMEDISAGERVREYVIEGKSGNEWKELARGTAIGHKKIDRFPGTEVSAVRMRAVKSSSEPIIARLAAYAAEQPGGNDVAGSVREAGVTIVSPMDYQVVQRRTRVVGSIPLSGRAPTGADAVEMRLTGTPMEGAMDSAWRRVPLAAGRFNIDAIAPAGGWYVLDVRALKGTTELATASVAHVGVGEVFVGAGQSNSTNSGGEGGLKTRSGMVATFSGSAWRLADDPQPGVHDNSQGGSFWPAFGDAMAERFHVPIGVAVTGHGGTSINQWQAGGELFNWMEGRVQRLGRNGFRALLWHQGESDVGMTSEQYAAGLAKIVRDSTAAAGWEFPWVIARVSYHNPQEASFDSTRNAQKALWDAGVALEGPDTDALGGDNRDGGGQGIHFSPKGLEAHGKLWADKVGAYVERMLAAEVQR